jgi:tetratricopeptide (TPR) repeat protein
MKSASDAPISPSSLPPQPDINCGSIMPEDTENKRRSAKNRYIFLNITKAVLIAGVIALAGWGISVRGERLRQAEILADIAGAGTRNAGEIRDVKWMIDKGEIQEAVVILKQMLREDDDNFLTHYFLGVAYARKGLPAEALSEFERVLELGGWEDRTYYNMAIIYESMGFYERAQEAYEAARLADPDNRDYTRARDRMDSIIESDLGFETQYQLRFNEASLAMIREPPDLELASGIFEYLIDKFPHKVEPLHMLGVVRARQGNLSEAEEIFLKAIDLEPSFALSYYDLGILYQTQGRWSDAREAFLRSLNLTTDDENREIIASHIRQLEEHIDDLAR